MFMIFTDCAYRLYAEVKTMDEKSKNERVIEITKALNELGYNLCEFHFVKSQSDTAEASEYKEPLLHLTIQF